jgi:large subunit ribosomal protein L10
MPTAQKATTINELSDALSRASLTIIADYRGLTVADLQGFRGTLRQSGATVRIAKNTLTLMAAVRVGITGLDGLLEGPTALVLAYDDPVAASKATSDFARTSRILTVRGGVLNKNIVTGTDIEALATMPPREVLLGRLVGMLASPMARTVGVLSGPSRSLAYLVQARVDQLGAGAPSEEIAAD